jgi:UDP-glucose 4-epimerase
MKIALVTGGLGFLGYRVAQRLNKAGFEVHGIGNGSQYRGRLKNFPFVSWKDRPVSLENLREFEFKPDVIFHSGGGASVADSFLKPREDFLRTVDSTSCVLEFIKDHSPNCRMIYPSSVAVHGLHQPVPIRTVSPLSPVSPYGQHKLIAEELCRMYSKVYGLKHSVIRFYSIYGENLRKQLLWEACRRFTSTKDPVEFWGTGSEVRDWLYVDDAAELVMSLVMAENPPTVVNGGSGVGVKVEDVLRQLATFLGYKNEIFFNGKIRVGDPQYYVADMGENDLDWRPKTPLAVGLERLANWFKSEVQN